MKSKFLQNCVIKQNEIIKTLQDLLEEVKKEGEKFGEDVKHLADFASSQKKFLPWIAKAEEKKTKGLKKPSNLNEARELLTDAEVTCKGLKIYKQQNKLRQNIGFAELEERNGVDENNNR